MWSKRSVKWAGAVFIGLVLLIGGIAQITYKSQNSVYASVEGIQISNSKTNDFKSTKSDSESLGENKSKGKDERNLEIEEILNEDVVEELTQNPVPNNVSNREDVSENSTEKNSDQKKQDLLTQPAGTPQPISNPNPDAVQKDELAESPAAEAQKKAKEQQCFAIREVISKKLDRYSSVGDGLKFQLEQIVLGLEKTADGYSILGKDVSVLNRQIIQLKLSISTLYDQELELSKSLVTTGKLACDEELTGYNNQVGLTQKALNKLKDQVLAIQLFINVDIHKELNNLSSQPILPKQVEIE